MKKYVMIIVLLVLASSIMIFVYQNYGQTDTDGNKIKIGFMVDSLVIERWQKDRDIFMSKAKELGAEVILKNANENARLQSEQVRELIKAEVDVIVIIPYDRSTIGPALKQAKRSGIKVISYDRLAKEGDVDLYISFDNFLVGQMMGEELVKKVPKGNYVIINGSKKDNNSFMLNEGYMSVLQPYINSGDIKILSEIWADDWREVYAYNTVNEVLDSGMSIQAIIGANDDLAEGAIRVLLERQLAGEVYVVGHDANLSACQRIVEGTQFVTIYKPIKDLAQMAAEIAVRLANGGVVESEYVINDGEQDTPFIKLTPKLVNKENIDEIIINDGFHLKEEVYRNIPKSYWPK